MPAARGSVPRINILNAHTGKFVGMLTAGPEDGLYGGWEDRVGSLQATERKNGEYLILVEEDEHARELTFSLEALKLQPFCEALGLKRDMSSALT